MSSISNFVQSIYDVPLKIMSSPNSSTLSKVVSAVAMAIFSIISLGGFITYAKDFYQKQKMKALEKDLESAVTGGKHSEAEILLLKEPDLCRSFLNGSLGRTPLLLHQAADKNDTKMVKSLIKAGADVNADGRAGTPLAAAVRAGHLSMVKELHANKADLNKGDGSYSPLALAADSEHSSKYDIMKYLIANGCKANVDSGLNVLQAIGGIRSQAHDAEVQEILKSLLDKGALLNYGDCYRNVQPHHLAYIAAYYLTKSKEGDEEAQKQYDQIPAGAKNPFDFAKKQAELRK